MSPARAGDAWGASEALGLCSHSSPVSDGGLVRGPFRNDTKTCNLNRSDSASPGTGLSPAKEESWPSGEVEQKLGSCDFLFIKYLGDDVTGRTFMDILQLGDHKTEVVTFCSLKKADCIS